MSWSLESIKLQVFKIATITLGTLTLITGCGGQSNSTPSVPGVDSTPPTQPNTPDVPSVKAIGWDSMVIHANWAKTDVTTGAHFATSRNACGKPAYGAIDGALWNTLATQMNAALKLATLETETCVDTVYTTDNKSMDGTVDVILSTTGKKTFLESKGSQICHKISDPQVATDLIASIQTIIVQADKEDCPNGWGSGLR